MSKAIYAGSFDPFTNGHLDIVKQASCLFDEIYLVISDNESKTRMYNADMMLDAIKHTLIEEKLHNVITISYGGLIAQLAYEIGIIYLIRGLRNTSDYQYEENIAKINSEINKSLNTIYFRGTNDFISSSMIRDLNKYNFDISKYVSKPVLDVIKGAK